MTTPRNNNSHVAHANDSLFAVKTLAQSAETVQFCANVTKIVSKHLHSPLRTARQTSSTCQRCPVCTPQTSLKYLTCSSFCFDCTLQSYHIFTACKTTQNFIQISQTLQFEQHGGRRVAPSVVRRRRHLPEQIRASKRRELIVENSS